MNDNLEYIDDYFQKVLNDVQREEFETRCVSDEAFAIEVATYMAMREVLRQNLLEEKKKHWSKLVPSDIKSKEQDDIKLKTFNKIRPVRETADLTEAIPGMESFPRESANVRTLDLKKWLSLAAAACVITFLLLYPMLTSNTARDLVHEYKQNEMTISNSMDASRDSVQAGIVAYNKKDYKEAIKIFGSLCSSNPGDQKMLQYLGQALLMDGDYESALKTFEMLSQLEGLRSNPGVFLKGITLMERNAAGDEEQAKTLFQKVVSDKLEGEKQAKVWLEKMD